MEHEEEPDDEVIPEVPDSGSTGDQAEDKKTEILPPISQVPYGSSEFGAALDMIVATNSRGISSAAATHLLVGRFKEIEAEKQEIRDERRSLQAQLNAEKASLAECQTRLARLQERLRHVRQEKLILNFASIGAGLMLSVAFMPSPQRFSLQQISILLIAIAIYLFAFFWSLKDGSREND